MKDLLLACVVATLSLGCSGSNSGSDLTNGGATGNPSVGGAVASGGANGTGGAFSGAGGTGAAAQTGGAGHAGGSQATGGAMTGGAAQAGGSPATGGARPATGGANMTGGSRNTSPVITGGSNATGGAVSTGGVAPTGGTLGSNPTGGKASTGGAVATGGVTAGGGSKLTGGTSANGGASGVAPTGGASAAGSSSTGPCDIYAAANTPCVAAHSTVRALYSAYSGKLYQVRRASDKTTQDILTLSPGGVANSATQDTFCTGTTCTISEIYDQSPNGNHLTKSPPGGWLTNGGLEANATQASIKLNGHTVYGVYTTMNWDDSVGAVGYRNNTTKGVATGDQPESMYMVVSGKHYNQWCCFDYGNAETDNTDDGNATMEAVYFGNSTQWGKGSGTGPWVMADLENGIFAGQSFSAPATNTSLVVNYVTAMLKGNSGNSWALKGGDAQSGSLKTLYSGARPTGYNPMKKQGAIILGTGGDNSHTGEGTFFEGCMTTGFPSDATDDAVQANIINAGYGK